jgi:hypothetical protein
MLNSDQISPRSYQSAGKRVPQIVQPQTGDTRLVHCARKDSLKITESLSIFSGLGKTRFPCRFLRSARIFWNTASFMGIRRAARSPHLHRHLLTETHKSGAKRVAGDVDQPLVRCVHLQNQEDGTGDRERRN